METINDVLIFLNKLEIAFCPNREEIREHIAKC